MGLAEFKTQGTTKKANSAEKKQIQNFTEFFVKKSIPNKDISGSMATARANMIAANF